jgi:predicted esterase
MLCMTVILSHGASSRAAEPAWCAAEFERLSDGVCASTMPDMTASVLVIFLHGVIKPDSGWQHQQQRAIARGARQNRFDVIMPRGRQGIGPKGMREWWTWPTARAAQELEPVLFEEWQAARIALESRRSKRYSKVFVFGFSNGAYYASQLVLRGHLPGHGAAAFAGGSSGQWLERLARSTDRRVPIYLECGAKDVSAKADAGRLRQLLARLEWPHRFFERQHVGHSISDNGVELAFEYLLANG